MDKAFWQGVAANNFAVPEGYTASKLLPELLNLLGSPDQELRDDIGYTALAYWTVRDKHYSPDEIRRMIKHLTENLQTGIGEKDSDSVILRSFSALVLSLMIYRDNQDSFLTNEEVKTVLQQTVEYLEAEQDIRGYVVGKGWLHSLAHTADTLKFLARNPKTDAGDHLQILSAIASKLTRPTTHAYVHDEDERLVLVVMEVLKRDTLHAPTLHGWIESFREWKQNSRNDGKFDVEIHATYHNIKTFLRALYFAVQMMASSPNATEAVKELELEVLRAVRLYGAGTIYASSQ